MRGYVTVSGEVLDVERKSGTFTGESGEARPYDFFLASVLCGTKVVEVKHQADNADAKPPVIGDTVSVVVELPKGTRPLAKRYVEVPASK